MSTMPPDDSTEAMRIARWRAYLREPNQAADELAWRVAIARRAGFTTPQILNLGDFDTEMLSALDKHAELFWPRQP